MDNRWLLVKQNSQIAKKQAAGQTLSGFIAPSRKYDTPFTVYKGVAPLWYIRGRPPDITKEVLS